MAYFDCLDLFTMPQGDAAYPYLEVNKGFDVSQNHRLEPFLYFGFPFSTYKNEFGHGLYARFGFRHFWQITPKFKLYQKVNLFFDDGAFLGLDSGVLGQYRCDLSWRVSKSVTLDLISVKISTPITSLSDERNKTNVSYGAGITYLF